MRTRKFSRPSRSSASSKRTECWGLGGNSSISALSSFNHGCSVEDVRDENYKGLTDAPAAIVACGLATCEPCKTYDPILEETAAKFLDVKVGKAKMHLPGRCREIKKSHTFETYPTTHFFAHGKLLLTRKGVVEPAELASLMADHLLK